jgi:tryptophan synthase alpha chain
VVFSYANPLLRMGETTFARQAAGAGVDGVLALDLPIEEAGGFRETLRSAGLDMIFLLSPTTTDARIRRAGELGSGFLYGISRLGVTGARDQVASGAEALVKRIRTQTALRSRSASGSRVRSTSPPSAPSRTRQWLAARWCRWWRNQAGRPS